MENGCTQKDSRLHKFSVAFTFAAFFLDLAQAAPDLFRRSVVPKLDHLAKMAGNIAGSVWCGDCLEEK
jgi:hypothetical protein